MPNCKTVLPFQGTPEQEAQLKEVIEAHRGQKGAAMPVLQKAQEIYGYLPEEVQIMVAEGLSMSLSEVYGIASFYSQFTLNPKGKVRVAVCMGTACYVKGAGDILDRVCERLDCRPGMVTEDGNYSIDATRCIGACGLAPVITINDDVYGKLTKDQVDGILEKYMV